MPDYEENFDEIFSPRLTRSDVRQEVEKIFRDLSAFSAQAQASVTAAIRELKDRHSDFEERRPQMLSVLEQIPLLKDAVASAEANPQLAAALPQIYETVYRAARAPVENNASADSESRIESQGDLSDEGAQYKAALASQQIDLSPANRRSLLADLEKRGILDIEF